MAESARLRRARERVDQQLTTFGFGPCYPVHDGDRSLFLHSDCTRCAASIRIAGDNAWRHWRTHHRLRAWLIEFVQQRRSRLSEPDAKPVHSLLTEPREDRT